MNLMLLCAGEGVRLRPYTLENPKPTIPFMTVPLACYSLSLMENIKVKNLVVNTFHRSDLVMDFFKQLRLKEKLHFTKEDTLLGSGGGIHNAKKHLEGSPFLVMNGDEVILPKKMGTISDLIYTHQQDWNLATLLVMKHPEVGKKFGGVWCEGNQVKMFSKADPGNGLVGYHFLGVSYYSPQIFHYFKNQVVDENILYETLTLAMEKGQRVGIQEVDALWFETGNPQDFIHATRFCTQEVNLEDQDYWKQYLMQTTRWFGTRKTLIENDFGLAEEVSEKVRSWNP